MCRSSLVLILLSGLVALIPFADANPPDSMWTGGVHDGDDYENVGLSPIFAEGVLESALLKDFKTSPMVVASLPLDAPAALALSAHLAFQFRSPPLS
jgi:hypothetical protein